MLRRNSLALALAICSLLAFAGSASAYHINYGIGGTDTAIADNTTSSSFINLAGPGLITHLNVKLKGLNSDTPISLDVDLVAPNGQTVMLVSDSCGSATIEDYYFEFDDSFTEPMTNDVQSCDDTQHPPSNFNDGGADFSLPESATTLAALNGQSPTGTWSLRFHEEDAAADHVSFDGWSLDIETDAPSSAIGIPGSGGIGSLGSALAVSKTVTGFPRPITDVDLKLNKLNSIYAAGLRFVLVSPSGAKALVLSKNCPSVAEQTDIWLDDEAPSPIPPLLSVGCSGSPQYWSLNPDSPDQLVEGAPPAPYATALSAFDGSIANGTWNLYVYAPNALGTESYLDSYDLAITTLGAKVVTASAPKLKFKKSGKSKIALTGRSTLSGATVGASECAGSVGSTLTQKVVTRKKKKKVSKTVSVAKFKSPLAFVAGACGVDFSARIKKKYAGASLKLNQSYLGGDYIAPFTRSSTVKVKKIKF